MARGFRLRATERFVGMFDIVGFKSLRNRMGTDELYQQWVRGILPGVQHSAAGRWRTEPRAGHNVVVPDFHERSVQYRVVSDTVILFTKDNSFESFVDLISSSFGLLCWGFNGSKAPFRGAIGYGDLIEAEEDVLLGSAIEDAYAGEGSQAWAGAMLTEACEKFAAKAGYLKKFPELYRGPLPEGGAGLKVEKIRASARRLVRYPAPLQRKSDEGPTTYSEKNAYVIDWTLNMYEGASEASFYEPKTGHAKRIVTNTIAFEKWARANNRD